MKQLAVILVVVATALSTFFAFHTMNVNDRKQSLQKSAIPYPGWVIEVHPKPSSTIDRHSLASEGEPFWPSVGMVCVLIDGGELDLNDANVSSAVGLSLDGFRIIDLDRFVTGYMLQGLSFRRGERMIFHSPQNPDFYSICWLMNLSKGSHLAGLIISKSNQSDVFYEWAFEIHN